MDRTHGKHLQFTSGLPTGAIDFKLLPSDSIDMKMRRPNWQDHSPYFWAILIFSCSRVVVALGLVFSQKYVPSSIERWSAGPLWYHQLLQWDSEWYFRIATEGYRYPAIRLRNRVLCFTRCTRCSRGASQQLAASRLRTHCCSYRTSPDCSLSSFSSSWFARNLAIKSLSPQPCCSAFFPLRSCCRPDTPSPWHC